MKMIFFSKYSKFYVDLKNLMKLEENVDGCSDNNVWTRSSNFYQLWQEYIWSPVNMLQIGPKISDTTNRNDTQLNFFDINGTLP